MAIQETHLSQIQTDEIQDSWYGKRLKIISTIDPDHPNAAGVAVALNYDLVNTGPEVQSHIIIRGRALCVSVPRHDNQTLTTLVVYPPNDNMTNLASFYNDLTAKWLELNLPVPDLIVGDHNVCEEPCDQSNNCEDQLDAIHALVRFKSMFCMKDGWCAANPTEQQYTYTHHG
ncbi:hypothetical protein GYMLUDRAFT_60937 [Collybiopsis luxurians FD-317 M1]|uniref:Unplaced genomic scaffold GYMLUscaffold_39, whole genome shotgun sequence n=1 Tax=Collybiopsis luxurians FD-317 M1 TaxID=944289 RepID=A0A0D0B4A5_9AGAR|nr:hypothetical protein GYMLUDRAFT_60937 [Collybiopsis luxurians FD-317 M1]